MNVEINYKDSDLVTLEFKTNVFNTDRDYLTGLAIVSTFCAEFELEPEMEPSDFRDLVESIREKDKDEFIFEISEGDIEVSFKPQA